MLTEANQTARQPLLRQWRVFPGKAAQISSVRRWLTSFLPDCDARDDLVSVATELASNAICHTRSGQGGHFAVEVSCYSGRIRLAVTDGGAQEGPKLITDPDGEHGRGLLLVRELAASTGVHGDHRSRLVWADVPFETGYPVISGSWEPAFHSSPDFAWNPSSQLNLGHARKPEMAGLTSVPQHIVEWWRNPAVIDGTGPTMRRPICLSSAATGAGGCPG